MEFNNQGTITEASESEEGGLKRQEPSFYLKI